MKIFQAVVLCAILPAVIWCLSFTQAPVLTPAGGGQFQVQFALDESTDVEVAIVSLRDSTILCRLAAGMLGANPPAPLAANSLSQSLTWNGRDDMGRVIDVPAESLAVRVRAGMSVKLDRIVGDNPYAFKSTASGNYKYGGIAMSEDGKLYAFGSGNNLCGMTLRQYDPDGNYLKTLFPFPPSLPASQVTGYGLHLWPGGAYGPVTTALPSPAISSLISEGSKILPMANQGLLSLVTLKLATIDLAFVGVDGSADTGAITLSTIPGLPDYFKRTGPFFTNLSPDNKYLYISGLFLGGGADGMPADTGFWQDGVVFKVEIATGITTRFIVLDTMPTLWADRKVTIGPQYEGWGKLFFSALQGVAFDKSGRVFVCDRLHRQVSVYDSNGTFIKGLPVTDPDNVTLLDSSVYVTTRRYTGYWSGLVRLVKFSDWRTDTAMACYATVTNEIDEGWGGNTSKTSVAAATTDSGPVIWFGYERTGALKYRDLGNTLVLAGNQFTSHFSPDLFFGFDRIAVDRRNETVYLNDSWNRISKIEDWGRPSITACSTSARARLIGTDFAISPDYQFYVRTPPAYDFGPIDRFTLDHYHAPIPYAGTGRNRAVQFIYSRMGSGLGEKGLAVGYDKKLAVMQMHSFFDPNNHYCLDWFPDSACQADSVRDSVWNTVIRFKTPGGPGGVKIDKAGNYYAGAMGRPATHVAPADYAGDGAYKLGVGSVVRYKPGDSGSVSGPSYLNPDLAQIATNADRVYRPGFAPISGGSGNCECRSPRFDLDPYGRLFIPNGITQKVAVVDNNDNPILEFGAYGNADCRGEGSLIPTPAIAFAMPVGAAASDNFIYITDILNTRLVRVKMEYALENMHLPEAAVSMVGATTRVAPTLAVAPNPFNPVVRLALTGTLESGATLKIFDLSGKLIADLSTTISHGMVSWNASGTASGIYVAVAQKGDLKLSKRIVYSK